MTATKTLRSLAAALLLIIGGAAAAQSPVKIGLIGEFTGPFADYGTQIYNGMKAYLKSHGDKPRTHQNRLLFLVPDVNAVQPLRDNVKRLLAWESIMITDTTTNATTTTEIGYISADLILDLIASVFSM